MFSQMFNQTNIKLNWEFNLQRSRPRSRGQRQNRSLPWCLQSNEILPLHYIKLHQRIVRWYVWFVLLAWTIKITKMWRLEAFELQTIRKIHRISSNSEVLRETNAYLTLTAKYHWNHVPGSPVVRGRKKYHLLQLILKRRIEVVVVFEKQPLQNK